MISLTFRRPQVSFSKDPTDADKTQFTLFTTRNLVVVGAIVAGVVILKQQSDIRNLTRAMDYMLQTNDVLLKATFR